MKVTFYEGWAAFPHTRDRDNYIGIIVKTGGSLDYEFMLDDVGSGPQYRERIALRLGIFSDAWAALTDLPELFAALRGRGDMSIAEARDMLTSLGHEDITGRYESRHEHIFRCECGERP